MFKLDLEKAEEPEIKLPTSTESLRKQESSRKSSTLGETMETVTDFIILGSKITADHDCSHEIKRHLLLGRKAKTNLHSVLKEETLLC